MREREWEWAWAFVGGLTETRLLDQRDRGSSSQPSLMNTLTITHSLPRDAAPHHMLSIDYDSYWFMLLSPCLSSKWSLNPFQEITAVSVHYAVLGFWKRQFAFNLNNVMFLQISANYFRQQTRVNQLVSWLKEHVVIPLPCHTRPDERVRWELGSRDHSAKSWR